MKSRARQHVRNVLIRESRESEELDSMSPTSEEEALRDEENYLIELCALEEEEYQAEQAKNLMTQDQDYKELLAHEKECAEELQRITAFDLYEKWPLDEVQSPGSDDSLANINLYDSNKLELFDIQEEPASTEDELAFKSVEKEKNIQREKEQSMQDQQDYNQEKANKTNKRVKAYFKLFDVHGSKWLAPKERIASQKHATKVEQAKQKFLSGDRSKAVKLFVPQERRASQKYVTKVALIKKELLLEGLNKADLELRRQPPTVQQEYPQDQQALEQARYEQEQQRLEKEQEAFSPRFR